MELPEDIQDKIDILMAESENCFAQKRYDECVKYDLQSWELIPDPKKNTQIVI
ncbi:hypothetical protein [Fibrisoma limi]|uniref:hypothetical protein n=1 Tax=Fibrisoma limi TaxID=663275 RepID=UPI001788CDC6|nr:hypothetical protein [Fibrisoma limi]